MLSIISSFYDPMGLISAYLVIFKIMMRETTALPDLDWDDPLPKEMQEDWKSAISMLVEHEEIVFDRCTMLWEDLNLSVTGMVLCWPMRLSCTSDGY